MERPRLVCVALDARRCWAPWCCSGAWPSGRAEYEKVLAQNLIDRQTVAHFCAFTLLLLAVVWPQWFVYPAGMVLVLANGLLRRNLISAVRVYRLHMEKIALLETSPAAVS